MRIIARRTLREFWLRHPNAEGPLRAWYAVVRRAQWRGTADLKSRFPSASLLAGNRVVFNVGGNKFRVVAAIHYGSRIVFIRFVGMHAEYDKIDAGTI